MYTLLPLLLLLVISGCSQEESAKAEGPTAAVVHEEVQQSQAAFQSITPRQAVQLIGNKTDLLIIDVRTTREIVQYGAMPDAVHTGIGSVIKNGIANPKDQPVLVVCAIGGRSYAVGKILEQQGHSEVYNLSGGMERWEKEGLPVVFPLK